MVGFFYVENSGLTNILDLIRYIHEIYFMNKSFTRQLDLLLLLLLQPLGGRFTRV